MSQSTAVRSIQQRILQVLLTAQVLMSGIIFASIYYVLEVRNSNQLGAASVERIILLNDLNTRLVEAETSQRAYLLTGDPVFIEELAQFSIDIDAYLQALQDSDFSAVAAPDEVEALQAIARARFEALQGVIGRFESEGLAVAQALVSSHTGKVLMDRYREQARVLEVKELAWLLELRARTDRSSGLDITLLVSGALFNLLMLALAFAIFRRHLLARQVELEGLQRRSSEIGMLNEMNSSLLSCTAIEEASQLIRHHLVLLFPGTAGVLYLYRASRNVLERQLQWGDLAESQPERLLSEECWALRRGHMHQQLAPGDLHCSHNQHQSERQRICVPMMAAGETLGMLHVIDAGGRADVFSDDMRLRLLETTTSQIASAIASLNLRAALHAQSIRDPLTGLFNRRYLEETMQREEMRAQRNKLPLSIIMADIDHFKNFNDTNGHHAGDLLLQAFGRELLAMVRGDDIACRYGGEEFLLILPGASLEKALERAEEVRAAVSRLKVVFQGKPLPQITCSFGVACYPQHGANWQAVLQRADVALYAAKHQGRNRSVVATPLQADSR